MIWALLFAKATAMDLKARNPPPPPFDAPGGITVISGGDLYLPKHSSSPLDVIISADTILGLLPPAETKAFLAGMASQKSITIKHLNASKYYVVPGLIDVHVHALGGGGEQGPSSRTPTAKISELAAAGLTTIVGLLGTDSKSRGLADLYQTLRGLDEDGISTYMWVGGYRFPSPTLTGSVEQDIILIDKVLGVGELAMSDHRSSWPNYDELVRTVSDARVAGLLAGKGGMIHFHMGSAKSMIDMLWKIVNETSLPITSMYPTHMSGRGDALIEEGYKWIKAGGFCDFTADENDKVTETLEALIEADKRGLPLDKITVSSDAYGSLPTFDSEGQLISYDVGKPTVTYATIKNLVKHGGFSLEKALQFSTANAARAVNLKRKGAIAVGNVADVLLLDKETLEITYVFGKGQILKTPTWVKKGMFEP